MFSINMKYTHANTCLQMWLVMLIIICFCFGMCIGCWEEEKTALIQIRDSIGNQPGSLLSSWLYDDCCQWDGVDCSPTSSRVARIFSYYVREEEQFPWSPDLSLFAQFVELQELVLQGNKISELAVPEALCNLSSLQRLDLSDNSIEGLVHPCWGNMPSLRILILSKNKFQGNPSSIFSNLTIIETIDVSHNHFQGPVPFSTFANLSKLRYLDLSYNQIEVETENPSWQPSFQLEHLLLADCNLNQKSNHGIPSFISAQYTLQTLDLSGNFFTGSIPIWMLHNVSSVLRLRGNMFSGNFPQSSRNVASPLVEFDISCNYFEGPLPLNINALYPRLYRFNVSTNGLTGTLPPSLGELASLQQLDLSNNKLVGNIPSRLTENSSLWYLNLSNNSLQGELLPQDCNMRQLKSLLLRDNNFVGSMPLCLSNSPSLLILDAGKNNLSGIISNRLPTFLRLRALLLGGNQIEGHIPMQLCQMKYLQILDLSNNNFLGIIPSCLSNNLVWKKKLYLERTRLRSGIFVIGLTTDSMTIKFTTKGHSYIYRGVPLTLMTGIDLSSNHLSDTIPSEIGTLSELHSLNLSHNLLNGHFPKSFQNLTNLESLDLSCNNLTGKIPWEIGQIDTLSTFSVAFNNLSGRVPFGPHLSTFTEVSYMGNPNLCGEPLEKKCSGEEKEIRHTEENGIVDEPLFFYSCVAMSYSLGFWSVVAPLFISKNWRRRYYAAVDGCLDMFLQKIYVIHDMLFYRN